MNNMKLIMESWRQYITEGPTEDQFNFGSIVMAEFLTEDDRHIVIVKTLKGPVAFYRSTGTGSGTWTAGSYLPFSGISPDGPANASKFWFAKMDPGHPQSGAKSSKVPKEGSEFDRIGKYLFSKYGRGGSGQRANKFMSSAGYKSSEDLGIKSSPMFGNPLYDAMATNIFLQKWGALGALGNNYQWWGIDVIDGISAEKQ